MRTDQFVQVLAADNAFREQSVARGFALALVPALAMAAVAFSIVLRPRPDIVEKIATLRVTFKFAVSLCLAFTAIRLALILSRPEADPRRTLLALATAPLLIVVGVTLELLTTPAATWAARFLGHYSLYCLASIPFLSLVPLVTLFAALRRGASSRPSLSGAAAGLGAGGLGAALYALHCSDDSPLFVAAWYPLAISIVAFAGAFAGPRFLRW
jgi:hypothetical protein